MGTPVNKDDIYRSAKLCLFNLFLKPGRGGLILIGNLFIVLMKCFDRGSLIFRAIGNSIDLQCKWEPLSDPGYLGKIVNSCESVMIYRPQLASQLFRGMNTNLMSSPVLGQIPSRKVLTRTPWIFLVMCELIIL